MFNVEKRLVGDINGDNNTIINGNHTTNEAPKPKEGVMCSLLTNIANIVANKKIHPELPDNLPYTVIDKINFNSIKTYLTYEEYFEEGLYLIENRLRTIEDSSIGNIKPQIFRYVQGFYISVTSLNPNTSSDEIIYKTEQLIISDLRDHYFQILSSEDLSHVRFVVYYVFASCKIFTKPNQDFIMSRNVNFK